jgi:hypothetical protein
LLQLAVIAGDFRIDKHSPVIVDLASPEEEMKEYASRPHI